MVETPQFEQIAAAQEQLKYLCEQNENGNLPNCMAMLMIAEMRKTSEFQ